MLNCTVGRTVVSWAVFVAAGESHCISLVLDRGSKAAYEKILIKDMRRIKNFV